MPELLLELLSEEIPARMQARAAEDLKRLVTAGLKKAGLDFESAEAFRELAAGASPVLGSPIIADTVFVIGGTGMAVGGLVALVLDNTIPGTRKERGLEEWDERTEDESEFQSAWERFRQAAD